MNIYYLINLIKKRLWLLIIIPIIGATVAFVVMSSLPKSYRSSSQLATGFTTDESVKLTDEKFNMGKTAQDFNNLIEQINSELVVTLVSYNLIIHDLNSDLPFRTVDYSENEDIKRPTEEQIQEWIKIYKEKLKSIELLSAFDSVEVKLLEQLKLYKYNSFWLKEGGLKIHRVKNSDFISIEFTSENPLLSAYVVNTLSREFIRYNRNLKSSLSDESVSLLAKLVEEKKTILDEHTARLNDFKSNNQVLNQQLESDLKISQIMEYEVKKREEEGNVNALRLSIAQTKNKLNKASSKNGRNNAKVLQLRDRINKLNQLYIDGGSQDVELENTIAQLRDEMQTEMTKLGTEATLLDEAALQEELDSYELQLNISESNLASINNTLARLRSQISSHNTKESTLEGLTKEVELATKEYNQALDKYNEYKNRSLVLGSSIRIVKEGQPALEPESSHTLIITALAGFSGFALCVVFIVLMEFVDFRIKTSDNFRKVTKLQLAGTVNRITTKNLKLTDIFSENNHHPDLVVFKQLLRKIRFELEGSGAHSVLVTSTKIGEGKTFFILCLAYSLSLIKKKILIIDTNFKNNGLTKQLLVKPNFHKMLEEGEKRRKNYLINAPNHEEIPVDDEEQEDQDFTRKIIHPTGHRNIDIIGSNPSTNSPMEILAGRDFKKMIKTFQQNYDYILMEGAALNDFPDTKELVEYVDIVLPVFSAESTIKQQDKESISYLKSLNGRLMGAVLNKVENENLKI
ncbi:hypothetical protein JMN32_21560 [Fulvivirga sp. 29W222]|uniref:Polysaccharide chain length determinant N-terminal domain-containing protein n=1 Tax=Fulvivirga marina TaxID=2494733 RepID=A0A937FZ95_9BACT|nr:Wzz/FepE/Etk N-terminal domain-containing protein [Fulvivirga marina]MBL6448914.1 hypothetical protein [Fulvivirga marina]